VGDIVMKNSALLFKWWWRYACEDDSFWRRVVKSIHSEDKALIPASLVSRSRALANH